MEDNHNDQSTSVRDVRQLGTFAAIGSLSYVFWICGGMEMVERLAYYGVRQLASLYGTDAAKNGGLGLESGDIGVILGVWLLVQGLVPVFTGGLSDRIGYKLTIGISTVMKIAGYLLMAWFASYWGFFFGTIVLAVGTGVFKPGIQGTIARSTNRKNSSVAWGIFYQTVNIGGFLGPVVAGYLRQLSWEYVFYACAAIISLNFLLLLTYREVDADERLARREQIKNGTLKQGNLALESVREFTRPTMIGFMLLFTGWWFMMYLYWDLGPLYFRDWVDTRVIVDTLWGAGEPSAFARRFWVMDTEGTRIMPEGMININSLLIMIFCFLVAGMSARLKAANSMAIGTFLAAFAFILIGGTNAAWFMVIGVAVFSLGEMLSSPKSLEFLGNIAPKDKKAMYLGFHNLPFAIGGFAEGVLGLHFYGKYAAKDTIAREALITEGMAPDAAAAVPNGEAFERLVALTGQAPDVLTEQLYASHNIGGVFFAFAGVGIAAAIGLFIYGRWLYRRTQASASS